MTMHYLNNSGSRFITLDKQGKKSKITLLTKQGKEVTRTVSLWETLGNFAVAHISYKGKKVRVFTDSILED